MVVKKPVREDSRVSEVCKRVRELAERLGPDIQLPPMRTLYTELATNRITLGEALRILEAEQVLYRKERQGIYVSPKIHQKSIHIVFNEAIYLAEPVSPFWHLLWTRLAQEAKRRRAVKNEVCTFHLVMPAGKDAINGLLPEDLEDQLRTQRIDGVLAIQLDTSQNGLLTSHSIPCVTFAGTGKWLVCLDSTLHAQLAVNELVRLGCKKLGLWLLKYSRTDLNELGEYKGFRQALIDHNLPFFSHLVCQPAVSSSWALTLQEQGYWLARKVFTSAREHWPDGLFIANDMFTDGALVALEELGLQIGKDLQIVSHATTGSPILFGRPRHLTLLEDDPDDIAQSMFALLDQLLANPNLPRQAIHLAPHIRQHVAFQTERSPF